MRSFVVMLLGLVLCEDDIYSTGKPKSVDNMCAGSFQDESTQLCNNKVDKIDNCLSYSSSSKCYFCAFGFDYNLQTNQCEQISDVKCAVVAKKNFCSGCLNGVLPDKNRKCEGNSTCADNCEVCMEGFGCYYCKEGYFSSDRNHLSEVQEENVCVKETKNIKNCWFGSIEEGCKMCKFNFFFKNGNCESQKKYTLDVFPKRKVLI